MTGMMTRLVITNLSLRTASLNRYADPKRFLIGVIRSSTSAEKLALQIIYIHLESTGSFWARSLSVLPIQVCNTWLLVGLLRQKRHAIHVSYLIACSVVHVLLEIATWWLHKGSPQLTQISLYCSFTFWTHFAWNLDTVTLLL